MPGVAHTALFRMGCWVRAGAIGLVVWVLSGVMAPAPSAARSRGISATGCNGCHANGAVPEARLTALSDAAPGQPLRILLEVETKNGPTAGFYLTADGGGTLSTIAGQGTQLLGEGIAHAGPKEGSGFVRFEMSWLAPEDPTGVQFNVWVVSANDNNTSGGDGASFTTLSVVSGCDGELYFRDADRDGYGSPTFGMRLDCMQREGYSTIEGDCDENNAAINPSAEEYCNERDDDCDDLVDEGSLPQEHYPDPDGDGHGEMGSESVLECPPPPSYAPSHDDCLEGNDTVFPGADELCDNQDNDCDNQFDERVKPTCGVGWCRRESSSCSEDACEPGEPRDEECNAFDDDCDDVVDEGVDCGADLVCHDGYCVTMEAVAGQGGASGQGSTAGRGGAPPAAGTGGAPAAMDPDAGTAAPASASSSKAGGCSVLSHRPAGWAELAASYAIAICLLVRKKRRRSLSASTAIVLALVGSAFFACADHRLPDARTGGAGGSQMSDAASSGSGSGSGGRGASGGSGASGASGFDTGGAGGTGASGTGGAAAGRSGAGGADASVTDASIDPRDAECAIAFRLDVCCLDAVAVTRAELRADPCLLEYPRDVPEEERYETCRPDDCEPISCGSHRPPSYVVAPSAGGCAFADECSKPSDCVLATVVGICCGCAQAMPASVALVDACFIAQSEDRVNIGQCAYQECVGWGEPCEACPEPVEPTCLIRDSFNLCQ